MAGQMCPDCQNLQYQLAAKSGNDLRRYSREYVKSLRRELEETKEALGRLETEVSILKRKILIIGGD